MQAKENCMKEELFMTVEEKEAFEKMLKELEVPQWVGEDGACAVIAPNKKTALSLLKGLMRRDVGEYEAKNMKYDEIVIAWSSVATQKDIEEYGDEFEWFCHWKKPETGHVAKTYAFRG